MRRSERSKTAPAVNAGWRRPLALGMVSSVAITTFGLPALADVNTKPAEEGESAASILSLNLMGDQLGGIGESRAFFPGGPEVDNAGLADVTLGNNEVLNIGNGITIPVDQIIDYGELGALLSRSTATDALNGEAVTGIAGANGGITLDGEPGAFGTAKIDLLSLFKATGADTITDQMLTKAELTAGVGGAHVKAVDGEFEDPDGFGGAGQYRVAEANLELVSPLVEQISAALYQSAGNIDQEVERIINDDNGISGIADLITGVIPGAKVDVSVDSNMQEEIFKALVAEPITSKNEVLTIDLSTGTVYIDLDKAYSGERPEGPDFPDGINNQNPNTELLDDQIYPIIGETIHDWINEAVSVAFGAVEGALASVTLNVDITTPEVPVVSPSVNLKWSANLMGDVQPLECDGNTAACTVAEGLVNNALAPLANTVIKPVRDFLLSDAGQKVYELAITDVKTGLMTQPIRAVLDPFFTVLNKVVSLQLNHQREVTCEGSDGAQIKGLEVSALSLGVLGGDNANDGAGRLNLGTAGVRLGACEAAAINPAITVDPGTVAPGDPTNVTGEGFTPDGDVTLQLVGPDGQPVGDPVPAKADPEGKVPSTPVPVPADAEPGDYKIVATDVTTDTPVEGKVTVTDGTTPQPGSGTIGDTVWEDTNKDGIQNDGEPGVAGVTVNLLDADGTPILDDNGAPVTATSDDSGKYIFDKLPNGDYTVQFVAPEGKTFSPAAAGDDRAVDSDPNAQGVTPVVTLSDDAPTTDAVDAGLVDDDGTNPQPGNGSIGDTVFDDANKDGLQTEGEAGVPNVVVNLLDADGNPVNGSDGQPRTTTTDDSGKYSFGELPNGDYVVEFVAPEGKTFSPLDAGDDDSKDSDAGSNGRTAPVTLTTAAPTNDTVDAGLIDAEGQLTPSLSLDPNSVEPGDTTEATGEGFTPDGDVTVQLVDKDGNPVGDPITVKADPEGKIPATAVPVPEDAAPGDYKVVATDVTTETPAEAPLKVTDGTTNPPAGEGSIGDTVWEDANKDGIQDEGEAGVPGVTVNLLDGSGAPVNDESGAPRTTRTDDSGKYIFDKLPNGEYTVEFVAPEGKTFSPADAGDDDAKDSDANVENGRTPAVALTTEAPTNTTVDAGLVDDQQAAQPSITVDPSDVAPGEETTVNGKDFEPNETVTVVIKDKDGNPIGDPIEVTTDENGEFTTPITVPEGTDPGEYEVVATDKDGNETKAPINVTDGGTGGGEGELGDRVWRDANSDGIQDQNESGLAGAVVNLLDAQGNAVTDAQGEPLTTTTDENGSYLFTGLELGEYIVEFKAPEGASFSPAEAGDDRAVDSDAGDNGRSQAVVLTAQAPVDRTIDAGVVNVPAVDEATVTVNPDEVAPGETTVVNGDGYAPNTEVTVTLTDKDGNPVGDPIKVTTDENGHFTTEVTVPEDAAPGELTVTAEDSEGNKDTTTLTVTDPDDGNNGENNGVLGDRVWRDVNKDGIQDANEPGLGNVKVNLLDDKGTEVASTTTSENGTYTFAGLKIKQYIVEFEAPKGASFAPAGVGSDNGVDSNADKDGRSELVTLTTQAPVNNSIDAGVIDAPAVDEATVTVNPEQVAPGETTTVNGEGYAPNTEVTVQLTDKDGKPVGEPVKVTTDENGSFSTQITVPEDAAPGEYTVTAEDTEGNKDDTRLLVTDGGNVGNDGATLGDYVWNDANKDGIQNKEEAGVAGVGVALLDAEGNPVLGTDGNALITTTGEDGKYGFGGLNYGEYTVQFNAPSGASFTKTAAGEDRNVDSDANKDGRTAAVSLSASASSNPSVDAGLVIDENAETPSFTVTPDEVAPGEEVTIEGEGYAPNTDITIELRDKDGNVIETIEVTTDDDGKFITKLTVPEDAKEGDYKVVTRDPKGVEQTRDLRVTDRDANTCSAEQGITVTPSKAKAGETVTVKGQGFTEGQTVAITVTGEDGKEVKVAINEAAAAQLITIDESCGFEFKIQLPKDIKEGTYDVNVNDEDGKTLESGQFEVVGSDQNNGNGDNDNNGTNNNDRDKDGLADTGANVIGYSLLGLLAAAGGVALTVAARRKARNS